MAEKDEVTALRDEIAHLHQDCQDLVDFIVSARSEISQIRPNDLKADKLPRAGKELDAIVMATESATDTIMSATERIMSAGVTDADVVNDACMEIFEACSFQDITGQRISKVVSTLEYIENYLDKLTTAWGHKKDAPETVKVDKDDEEAGLLNGPALAGEGIDQNFVDSMFDDAPADAPDEKKAVEESEEKGKSSGNSDSIDQDDIDAMFN
ncbi:MAG: protein phosphatase CheZ [Sneathiellales bacterium]|nr:protein phosphatase CheZ [Sneathiellales bacterium]